MKLAVCIVLLSLTAALLLKTGHPAGGPAMRTVGLTNPPPGAVQFCLRHPAECQPVRRQMAMPARMADLVKVNREVNEQIVPMVDSEQHGMREKWSIPTRYGDCEDFAILKRKRLIAMGWPSSSLLLAVAYPRGVASRDGHAVLIAALPHGDFVLDASNDDVLPWHATGYRWLERQTTIDPRLWIYIYD